LAVDIHLDAIARAVRPSTSTEVRSLEDPVMSVSSWGHLYLKVNKEN